MTTQPPENNNPNAGIKRETFAGSEMVRVPETASVAIAAAAKATIEARYILAVRNPRNMMDVRIRLLRECERPGFAEAAIYRKPVGRKLNPETNKWEDKFVEGMSVRFAEAAFRSMTNMYRSATFIYDDEEKAIVRVAMMDLETNSTAEDDIAVTKTVERKELKKNQKPIATRTNSYGEPLYIVAATDDEVLNKVNALKAKARRNCMLELVPGDIIDECEAKCRETMAKADAQDPDAAKKRIFDAFAKIGVMPAQLLSYLELAADAPLNPAQLRELRGIFSAIQDGDTTWAAIVEAKAPVADGEKKSAAAKKVEDILKDHTAKVNKPKPKDESKAAAGDTKPAGGETKAAADETKTADPAADKSGNPEPGANG